MVFLNSYNFLRMLPYAFAFLIGVSVMHVTACSEDQGRLYSRDPVDPNSFGKAEEDAYSTLLNKYVTADKKIKYISWLSSDDDVARLKALLDAVARLDVTDKNQDEKKAFYINAYNAMTIDLILSHFSETLGAENSPYPNARSIRNIGNLDAKVWDEYKWKVAGQTVSLNDVEHKILRPMGDARIHFAIVCASKGCPPILNRAFNADSLNQVLDQLADEFVNSGLSTNFDLEKKQINTSQILSWFSQDFVKSFGSIKNFFAKYVTVIPSEDIAEMRVRYVNYDWLLNIADEDSPPPPEDDDPPGSGTEEELGSGSEEVP